MLNLSESEKQEVIRYLEADQDLPDKYRFLLFEDKREVELVWNGKTNEVCNIVLPFQTIEQVDEPRAEKPSDTDMQMGLFDMDERGRQLKGWTNKLIWGDNKLVLSSLKNGPMREEIEKQGGIKLIYIDPPFDVGADFSMDIEIGDDTFTKRPNILEEIAYRDTWGLGADSFISMIYERLALMKELLAKDGAIYVHCDYRLSAMVRLCLDELFGSKCFVNEIIWRRRTGVLNQSRKFGSSTDTIYYYAKDPDKYVFNQQFMPYSDDDPYVKSKFVYTDDGGRRYRLHAITSPSYSPSLIYEYKGYKPPANGWSFSLTTMKEWDAAGRLYFPEDKTQRIQRKQYLDETDGKPCQSLWDDIRPINSQAHEDTKYPTQKPESLLERIVMSSSNEGDLVADFFCGAGTTAAVAERTGRKWLCADLGKFSIHTTRKRMISVQRQLKADGKDYRAFELLNLGKYERQHYVGVNLNLNLREEEQQKQIEEKEAAFISLILKAYKAEKVENFQGFHGKKAGRLVAIGPVNLPITRLFVEEIVLECRKNRITKVDILGFEFEMGLFPNVLDEARAKGIDIQPKYIPAEVFDRRAVERNQVVFHDVAYIEVKSTLTESKDSGTQRVSVELTDFSVFYSQDSIAQAEDALTNKKSGSKIVVERGQIVKLTKDNKGIVNRERLTNSWTDWIDYWAVDYNFENKREIIRITDPESGEVQEQWTGEYVFENEWQSFRTKKDRSLELKSVPHECSPGRRKIAVKVVDIFGNDTMTIVEVNVGGKQ